MSPSRTSARTASESVRTPRPPGLPVRCRLAILPQARWASYLCRERRIEVRLLRDPDGTVDIARTMVPIAAPELVSDLLQEGIAAVDGNWPSGDEYGIELVVGETERCHRKTSEACANWDAARTLRPFLLMRGITTLTSPRSSGAFLERL